MSEPTLPTHPRFINLTGRRYSRFTVIAYTGKRGAVHHWRCRCDCGGERDVASNNLTSGNSKNCGCVRREVCKKLLTKHGATTFRGPRTPEYQTWQGMNQRCSNPNDPHYHGKGIRVCERWSGPDGFRNFLADMGPRPKTTDAPLIGVGRRKRREGPRRRSEYSVDRIDGTKGYESGNCRWATQQTQVLNQHRSVKLTHNGKTLTTVEWSEITGLRPNIIYERYQYGWPVEKILTKPPKVGREVAIRRSVTIAGHTKPLGDWLDSHGISFTTFYARVHCYDWTEEEALATPTGQKRRVSSTPATS